MWTCFANLPHFDIADIDFIIEYAVITISIFYSLLLYDSYSNNIVYIAGNVRGVSEVAAVLWQSVR